ncbi:Cacna1c [Symbiodinium sp. CCMP2592]|nr:Cacna1c [Symbiodinium sp. CCMP2592]
MEPEAFAQFLDKSFELLRRQLLDVYSESRREQAPRSTTYEPRFSELERQVRNLSMRSENPWHEGGDSVPISDAPLRWDLPSSRQQPLELGLDDSDEMEQVSSEESDDKGGLNHGSSDMCLPSGLRGLSPQEMKTVRHRLRLRLGILGKEKLISGKQLHDAVCSLGLTRYTEDDTNDILNQLATWINLTFDGQAEMEKSWEMPLGLPMLGLFEREGPKFSGEPSWEWPSVQESKEKHHHEGSSHNVATERKRSCAYNVVPVQALIELLLAQEGDIQKKIFGSRILQQFKAIREILLASDTNRLVAELTFVRINDLAAPPENVNFLMYMEPFVGFLILANGILIGLQTDPTFEDWPHWVYVEMVFNFFLVLEVTLRLCIEGCRDFWCGVERTWNWFDMVLMCTGIVDTSLGLLWSASEIEAIEGASLLRFCRLLRLARIVKVFRLKLMKDLRLMVKGLIAGIWTLSLAFVLLFAVLYVIAGFATMILGHSNDLRGISEEYFYNIPMSMFTAFRCFTGECVTKNGESITSILAEKYGAPFVLSFVVSYMLVTMGIFNVILAVYVDITMKAAKAGAGLMQCVCGFRLASTREMVLAENESLNAEQYSRESLRIARCTRELLKRFAAANHQFNETEDHHVDFTSLNHASYSSLLTDDELHEDIAINKELFLIMLQDRGVHSLMDELDIPPERYLFAADAEGTWQSVLEHMYQSPGLTVYPRASALYNLRFMHIPKTGGMTAKFHCSADYWPFVSEDTFCFARNPYARVVSAARHRGITNASQLNTWVQVNVRNAWRDRDVRNHNIVLPVSAFITTRSGERMCSSVLRTESLASSLCHFLSQREPLLDVAACSSEVEFFSREGLTRRHRLSARDLSNRSIALINNVFEMDFYEFGYKMWMGSGIA